MDMSHILGRKRDERKIPIKVITISSNYHARLTYFIKSHFSSFGF